jgi:hypothetical protein
MGRTTKSTFNDVEIGDIGQKVRGARGVRVATLSLYARGKGIPISWSPSFTGVVIAIGQRYLDHFRGIRR